MHVLFFSVRASEQSASISTLCAAFGADTPKPSILEGGEGLNYLCCVNLTKDKILELCEKHGYEVNGLLYPSFTVVEIEETRYNSAYEAVPCYGGAASYSLEPREHHSYTNQ